MDSIGIFVGGVLVGFVVAAAVKARDKARRNARNRRSVRNRGVPIETGTEPITRLYAIAGELNDFWQNTAQPEDIIDQKLFREGVEMFRGRTEVSERLGYAIGDHPLIACMALESLVTTGPVADDDSGNLQRILDSLDNMAAWTQSFALRAIGSRTPPGVPLIGRVFGTVTSPAWAGISQRFLRKFVEQRLELGEAPDLTRTLSRIRLGDDFLEAVVNRLAEPHRTRMQSELRTWKESFVDVEHLRTVGRVWSTEDTNGVIEHAGLRDAVDLIGRSLIEDPARSVLLVGEAGVGKTSAVRVLAGELIEKGWVVFEAGRHELVSGTVYHGQFEERVTGLLRRLAGKRVLWFVPDFHHFLWAGRTSDSQTGLLDHLLPRMEKGEIILLGETEPPAFERLAVEKPRCRNAMEAIRMRPLDEEGTFDLARRWATQSSLEGIPVASEETLTEAWQLTQQFLQERAAPGSLLRLLESAHQNLLRQGDKRPLHGGDLINTLSRLSGLPARILDERESLDLDAMRRLFSGKVMGQPEAVECLVQRVSMVKAGVTDPTRPLGVFLFAGPTGTGKTELCKALAEFLFGSPQRMIRIDMSELKTPDSLDRLVGTPNETPTKALVDQIREQPFSVVLLDEFEKAHDQVWDLFLQVFDDGRLTDRLGNTADFRHAIIVLTSNLGALVPTDAPLGFGAGQRFDASEVHRVLARTFRREFLNRIDRVVVFRPLTREIMRGILDKELHAAYQRRGLRNRPWAVEWDESALEFLLDKGFTRDLGARPLKRAIEDHVLAPLAAAIVTNQLPDGEQFLFVRSDGKRIRVEFVDPDEDDGGQEAHETSPGGEVSLQAIALEPLGTEKQFRFLRQQLEELRSVVCGEAWRRSRTEALESTGHTGFWQSPERFDVLGELEYRDRVERRLKSTAKLLGHVLPRAKVREVALRLLVIRWACEAIDTRQIGDAVVVIEANRKGGPVAAETGSFVKTLCDMYAAWSLARGMRCEVLGERPSPERARACLGVTGLGALPILRLEHGIHVLETRDGVGLARQSAVVLVAELPEETAGASDPIAVALARVSSLRGAADSKRIVRRYRAEPSPLVRDSVRGWRTGRLDQVLAGDFDLLGASDRVKGEPGAAESAG